jgi:hypothetical protein
VHYIQSSSSSTKNCSNWLVDVNRLNNHYNYVKKYSNNFSLVHLRVNRTLPPPLFGLAWFRLPKNWLKKFIRSSKLPTLVVVVVGLPWGRRGRWAMLVVVVVGLLWGRGGRWATLVVVVVGLPKGRGGRWATLVVVVVGLPWGREGRWATLVVVVVGVPWGREGRWGLMLTTFGRAPPLSEMKTKPLLPPPLLLPPLKVLTVLSSTLFESGKVGNGIKLVVVGLDGLNAMGWEEVGLKGGFVGELVTGVGWGLMGASGRGRISVGLVGNGILLLPDLAAAEKTILEKQLIITNVTGVSINVS